MNTPTTTTRPIYPLAAPLADSTHALLVEIVDTGEALRVVWVLGGISVAGDFRPTPHTRPQRLVIESGPGTAWREHVAQRSDGHAPAGDWRRDDVAAWLAQRGWLGEYAH